MLGGRFRRGLALASLLPMRARASLLTLGLAVGILVAGTTLGFGAPATEPALSEDAAAIATDLAPAPAPAAVAPIVATEVAPAPAPAESLPTPKDAPIRSEERRVG